MQDKKLPSVQIPVILPVVSLAVKLAGFPTTWQEKFVNCLNNGKRSAFSYQLKLTNTNYVN